MCRACAVHVCVCVCVCVWARARARKCYVRVCVKVRVDCMYVLCERALYVCVVFYFIWIRFRVI
jgi:hypothetical protein